VGFFQQYALWLLLMAALAVCSAFCSASEAALFYLGRSERRRLAAGNHAQRTAAALLQRPERLLTAILFWNLVFNLSYFTLDSLISVRLQQAGRPGTAGAFAVGTLLGLILMGELLPKSLAVLAPRGTATALAVPLSMLVRLADPLLPAFRLANLLSRRLIWPRFEPEPYLHVSDLERAVRLSTADAALVEQEQRVLEHIVWLSEIRVDELMRPRPQVRVFRPPVALSDLQGEVPRSGYALITEPESDEVVAAVPLRRLSHLPPTNLERLAEPVVYVPWSTTVAQALEALRRQQRRVAVVINEYGETIGVLPLDDIVDTVFSRAGGRSERLMHRQAIRQVAPGVWHVTGITSVRRLFRQLDRPCPPTHSVTLGGVVQELLERLPQPGDVCDWGPYALRVLDVPDRGRVLVEMTLKPEEPT